MPALPPSATRPLFSRCSIRKRYATALLAVLHPETGIVRYANAGHNPALVLREQGGVEELHSTGIPLGMIAAAEYTTEDVTLEPGDTIVIYTDGVTEARNHQDEEYAPRRLKALCRKHCACSAPALGRAINTDLDAFTHKAPYDDDRTLVIARRLR